MHGLSRAFLSDKPAFGASDVAGAFLEFVGDAQLIAHNAAFDRGFVNSELGRAGLPGIPEGRWVDSLAIAQKRFPGMYNSLDALCKRFKISLAEREKHGALVDAQLLAGVYLELQGGREASLDLRVANADGSIHVAARIVYGPRPRPIVPRLTMAERAAHERFVAEELKADAVWLSFA